MRKRRTLSNCFPRERCARCCGLCERPYVIPALRGKKPKLPAAGGAVLSPSSPREMAPAARA